MRWKALSLVVWAACLITPLWAGDASGNRLTYLDGSGPYYVSTTFPRLTTPQWVGEEGVDAVVVLAIDDMRDPEKYEVYLRPILDRLKQIDGRAPVSIMTCSVKPDDSRLKQWLDEGLSIEIHTIDHPCPLLQKDNFSKAKETYERCIDQMSTIPGNAPLAFRIPCCDSLNTVSPRFYAEIFNRTTSAGRFLTIDSSVFNVFTRSDSSVPRDLLVDADGKEKFQKYIPAERSFVNTIENYPYPYVINRLCWELPCVAPSDWSAQNYRQEKCHPDTVRDWKAALDITVLKQGVMNLVFHPHGWIRNDQINDLIDHAVMKYGTRVKFLTFRDVQQRLDKNLLIGNPLRDEHGNDNGVRVLDVDYDGYLDVVIGNRKTKKTRIWSPATKSWNEESFPDLVEEVRFGIERDSQYASAYSLRGSDVVVRHFQDGRWAASPKSVKSDATFATASDQSNTVSDFFLRDIEGDGKCELLYSNHSKSDEVRTQILALSDARDRWKLLPFSLPSGTFAAHSDRDNGLRFVDLDEDGRDDIVFSNARQYAVQLFDSITTGWSRTLVAGVRGEKATGEEIPPIVRDDGSNNGFWFHSRQLWWQNENTAQLKDLVARRSFDSLLQNEVPGPKSPADSLKSIVVRPGFTVELVAAEPLVKDPVAFEWSPDGRLWVVEMADYPVGIDGQGKPGGRIRVLDDSDGDGKYDHATLFLDGLNFPSGVMPWRNGALITAAPDIIFAEDTDGDGRANRQDVVYTGFGEGNQQHRVNGFTWGLDNWVYCANGDSGGRVRSAKTGETINIRGRDFRIRPDSGQIEPQLGSTQFGRNRDDWGNWFGGNNSTPMWQYVLDDHYLRRNPHVISPEGRKFVSVKPGPSQCYPVSRTLSRFNDLNMLNHFTSACSAMIYRDELFGPEFVGNSFVSEPVHNLVHREVVTADGVNFTSRRAEDEQQSEFLASRDNWFRPAMLKTGPDGALYIADMYRKVIEHTQYIPTELQKGLDVRAGDDKGRIYRVFPKDRQPRRIPNLAKMTTAELVAALDSPNGWQRDTSQRLLIQRNDRSAVAPLETTVRKGSRPLARLHALCTLDGIGTLTPSLLVAALSDRHAGVRRHAVRLSELFVNNEPELGKALLERLDDSDPHVTLQSAYSLGEWKSAEASRALGSIALKGSDNRYLMAAVISSVNEKNVDAILEAVASTAAPTSGDDNQLLSRMLNLAAAVGDRDVLRKVVKRLMNLNDGREESWHFNTMAGVLDTLDRRKSLGDAHGHSQNALNQETEQLAAMFDSARANAANEKGDEDLRIAAIRLLARQPKLRDSDTSLLSDLLSARHSGRVQSAAVRRLGELNDAKVPAVLLSHWKALGPRLRTDVLNVLFSRTPGLEAALSALEQGQVPATEIDATRRALLLEHQTPRVRTRAEKLFAGSISADRQRVLEAYKTSLTLTPSIDSGKQQFVKHCSICHKLDGAGYEVGPDLASVKDKSPESLMVAILDPNRSIESRYLNYMAVTNAGKTYNGVLSSETGESITLLAPKEEKISLLRGEVEILQSTSKSTMPEGLEKDLKPQDLADVMAYVRQVGANRIPSNQAGRFARGVSPGEDGSLTLLAADCEIYGSTLVREEKHDNLGFWQSPDDQAVWPITVAQGGKYEVWAHFACEKDSAGNTLTIECGKSSITFQVESTGDWDSYRRTKLGELVLPEGAQRLIAQAKGTIRGSLMDLKSLRLVPATADSPAKQ